MKLSQLKKGDTGKVISIDCTNLVLKNRLLDMGITIGIVIDVKKTAPLGDPVSLELRGYELCLRKEEMSCIEVIKL